jgi:hypothetical protein
MAIGSLIRQPAVASAKGKEHLGPRGGKLAVPQHGELGIVHPAEVEHVCQGRQHPMGPTISGMPDPDQVRKGDTARYELVSKTQVIWIRIATILCE